MLPTLRSQKNKIIQYKKNVLSNSGRFLFIEKVFYLANKEPNTANTAISPYNTKIEIVKIPINL